MNKRQTNRTVHFLSCAFYLIHIVGFFHLYLYLQDREVNVKKERSVPLSFITLHSFFNPTKGPDCVVVGTRVSLIDSVHARHGFVYVIFDLIFLHKILLFIILLLLVVLHSFSVIRELLCEEEKKEHNGMNKVNGSVVPFFSLRFTHTNSPQRSVV